jgi:hypothetical protein
MTDPTKTRQATSHIPPFGVRMQPDLKARLEAAAKDSGRSLNAEIVARLERTIDQDARPEQKMVVIEELENLLHGVLDRIDNSKKS